MSNLLSLIHQTVERYPDNDALMWKQDNQYLKLTYREFWKRSEAFAYALQDLGVQSGSKVAILANNCLAWTIADFGIMMSGAVTVPIYATSTPHQIEFILQNADVEAIVVENDQLLERVLAVATEALHSVLIIQPTKPVQHPGVMTFDSVIEKGQHLHAAKGTLTAWQTISDDQLATIVHTSGTTGNPKGVMLTHGNLYANLIGGQVYLPLTPQDRSLSYLPLSHIFERTCGQFMMLTSGGCFTYCEGLPQITANLAEVKPTVMTSVPRLFEKIYDGVLNNVRASSKAKQAIFRLAMKVGKQQITSPTFTSKLLHPLLDKLVFQQIRERMGGNLRLLVSGGAALSPTVGEFLKIAGLTVCEGYGLTETSPVISTQPISDPRIGTVGLPLNNVDVKIAADGEVLAKGPSIMVGYYKNPEATREAFTEDGYFMTGDIGEFVDGYLRIVERKKNILVLATGKNVAPFPIESAMMCSPYIGQAILIGDKRKYVSALIVPDFVNLEKFAAEKSLNLPTVQLVEHPEVLVLMEREIKEQLAEFASFERPKKFKILPQELTLESGELTPSLKVRLHVLQTRYQAEIEAMYQEQRETSAV
ncbi:AMP-dependent synthetase/ligase [Tumebacillus permanentifrigoris]|uniref:Long-chain acyl-CoA synthetase n=1 Tax=Tumebacillus permanentifrigoris TaxID=378543 RepID=A0A316D6N3_9BACL|nr:long-chain fatty acid--CoA ligase [Tumebacillus permanentifrigoris]PWK11258.1 long-chain acyl-CoA synthetase [Tumebacillus permanentifrigoris]